jgi:hypothetical protein
MKHWSSSRKFQHGAAAIWVFVGFAALALFFLWTEHRAHLYGWLPYLLLAACPLMHLFHGHGGGHGGHGGQGKKAEPRPPEETAAPPSSFSARDPAAPNAHHHH